MGKTFDPRTVSGEQFAAMLEITNQRGKIRVAFPNGAVAIGTVRQWLMDSSDAGQELIQAAGGFFQLVACARKRIQMA